MKKINKNLILIGFLILFPLLCVYYSYLNSSNIMYPGINQTTNLKLSQGSELPLNQERHTEYINTEENNYYITVPEGNIYIKVTWGTAQNMDLRLSVYSDQSYSDLLASSDNPGEEDEFIELYIDEEITIYIQLLANSGSGWFNILVYDDTYIDPVIIIIIIVVPIIGIVTGIIVFRKRPEKGEFKNYRSKI